MAAYIKINEKIQEGGQIYMKYAECADRKKNHILDFSDFHFSSYGHLYNKNCQFLMNFHDNSKNKRI